MMVLPMKLLVALVVIVGGLFALDRFALWMESRGWIYYRRRKPSTSTLGNAFLQVQSLLEPEKRTLLEVRREEQVEEDESGEPPDPGATDEDAERA
jgi:hypothetical protein